MAIERFFVSDPKLYVRVVVMFHICVYIHLLLTYTAEKKQESIYL